MSGETSLNVDAAWIASHQLETGWDEIGSYISTVENRINELMETWQCHFGVRFSVKADAWIRDARRWAARLGPVANEINQTAARTQATATKAAAGFSEIAAPSSGLLDPRSAEYHAARLGG